MVWGQTTPQEGPSVAGRPCSICTHPSKSLIEQDWLTRSGSIRDIAKRHGVKHSPLQRHTQNCIPPETKQALAVVEARSEAALSASVAHSAELVLETRAEVREALERVKWAADELQRMANSPALAAEPGERRQVLSEAGKMVKVINDTLRLHAQLTGELSTVTTQVAVINSAADFLASNALPAETARAQQACADAVLSAWKDAVTRLGTAEDYQEADAEGLRRLDAKIAELAGGVSGKGGRR